MAITGAEVMFDGKGGRQGGAAVVLWSESPNISSRAKEKGRGLEGKMGADESEELDNPPKRITKIRQNSQYHYDSKNEADARTNQKNLLGNESYPIDLLE